MEELILNYESLNNYLNEQKNIPGYAAWELEMLRDNCQRKEMKDNNWNIPKEFTISINHETWDVTINWKNVEEIFDTLWTFDMSKKNKIYRQVILALDEAKDRGIYDLIFKTKKKLDTLKESIKNQN